MRGLWYTTGRGDNWKLEGTLTLVAHGSGFLDLPDSASPEVKAEEEEESSAVPCGGIAETKAFMYKTVGPQPVTEK